jgi:predicted dehydrogenase
MLAEEHLDVVTCYLPSGLNAYASMAAARKGCHVISEVPLAADLKTLAALESTIRENNVYFTANLHMRLDPGIAAARAAIAGGLIGEPVLTFAQVSYQCVPQHGRPAVFGGRIPSAGIHALDAISYTTGAQITQVSILQSNTRPAVFVGAEDTPGILVKLSSCGTGIVSLNYVPPEASTTKGEDRLRIVGTRGVIEMNGKRVRLTSRHHPPRELPLTARGSILENFVSFLRRQGEPVVPTEEAFHMSRVALLVEQAAEEGRAVGIA